MYNILVIDEESEYRSYYDDALSGRSEGAYQVDFADTLEDGLASVRERVPDCVVFDFVNASEEKLSVIDRFKIEFPFVPAVVLTVNGCERAAVLSIKLGASDYLVRLGLAPDALASAVVRAIDKELSNRGAKEDSPPSQCHVLIIDDSPEDRELYTRSLSNVSGYIYKIFEAEDCSQGLAMLRRLNPDCVLLDYSMPGSNGLEMLKTILAEWSEMPVIIFSAIGNEAIAVEAMKQGAQDYINKSDLDEKRLHRLIQKACENRALHQQVIEQRDSLSLFTYALAHDLKEPLRTIQAYANLIVEENISPACGEYVEAITSSAEFMEHLVAMVHSFTQIETIDLAETAQIRYSKDLVNRALKNIESVVKKRVCEIETDHLPLVRVNEVQYVSVFQNLIANALRYNDKDVAKIWIQSHDDDHYHYFTIKDNGPGIPSRFLRRIFDPFKRASTGERGTGLGLAIVKKVVEFHGGRIWIESVLGEGASFHFSLPKPPELLSAEPLSPDEEAKVHLRSTGSESRLANVLYVEDSVADLRLAELVLLKQDKMQFNFYSAQHGEEALRFLANSENPEIDLILLDVNMPTLDGFTFLKELRRTVNRSLPVIMCTTSEFAEDHLKSVELGAKGYIVKPARLEQLLEVVDGIPSLTLSKKGDVTLLNAVG